MAGLSSLIITLLLLPKCKCPNTRNLLIKSPIIFTRYNTTNEWWLNRDRLQKEFLRDIDKEQQKNVTVVMSSFHLLMSAIAVAVAVSDQHEFPALDPKLAYYHTTMYRWLLRQLSLYRDVIYDIEETNELCYRRYYYEDTWVPQWIRKSLFWVDKTSWDKEEELSKRFNKDSAHTFDKYDRFPPKKFVSHETFSNSTSIYYPGPFDD